MARPASFAKRPLTLDDKAAKLLDAEAKGHLAALVDAFRRARRVGCEGARG